MLLSKSLCKVVAYLCRFVATCSKHIPFGFENKGRAAASCEPMYSRGGTESTVTCARHLVKFSGVVLERCPSWPKERDWKSRRRFIAVSWVRIPPSPLFFHFAGQIQKLQQQEKGVCVYRRSRFTATNSEAVEGLLDGRVPTESRLSLEAFASGSVRTCRREQRDRQTGAQGHRVHEYESWEPPSVVTTEEQVDNLWCPCQVTRL